jgi:hypothetical protein
LKHRRKNIDQLTQTILLCSFAGNSLMVESVATPLRLVDESSSVATQSIVIHQIKAIVNNSPSPQIEIQGEINPRSQQAVNLEQWLLPFNTTLKLLDIQQRQLPNGELELKSPYLLVRFNLDKLRSHPKLGRVVTIGDLQKLPGVKINFDNSLGKKLRQQGIALKFSYTLPKNLPQLAPIAPKVSLDGLATINPPMANLSAVQERINLSGSDSSQLNTQGEFKAVGTVLGSSWYLRVDQPKLANLLTWGLSDAVVINQSASSDWIFGSQSSFWRRQGNDTGTYWGITTILRQGFTPPISLSGGDFTPNERLQSSSLGRTVIGQASPGTVVRLVKGFSTDIVGQVLVDSSGIFRFEHVVVSNESEFGSSYRLLLYPNGQLTADPQVRDVTFTTVPGQLSGGSSAWIASAGGNYARGTNEFIGSFDRLQGGVAYRRGINESLTVGGGIIADPIALRGLGEVFWQPTGIPLQASVSAITSDQWDVVSNVSYKPAANLNASFSNDKLSSRADINWLLSPKFTLSSKYDSLSGVAIGGNYDFSVAPNSSSNLQGTFDTQSFLRWSASHQQNQWKVGLQGNEISFNSEVSYRLPSLFSGTQNLVANYQSTYSSAATTFGQFIWRYQSTIFQSELGYGWSGFGHGANAGIGVTLSPGLKLTGKYQGISASTNRESFSLELQSTIDLQGGTQVANTRVEDLRTHGGIAIQPFFDRNGNGKQEPGEEKYWHPELITLDKKVLNSSQIVQLADKVEIKAAPGSYRLDLNSAYLPAHWRSSMTDATNKPLNSIRVNVALGSYTTIAIPLMPIYTVRGIVTDPAGKPLSNLEVVAINISRTGDQLALTVPNRRSTRTKSDGSYEFVDLALGAYEIFTSGQLHPATIAISASSPVLQQLNLRQTAINYVTAQIRLATGNDLMCLVNYWYGL